MFEPGNYEGEPANLVENRANNQKLLTIYEAVAQQEAHYPQRFDHFWHEIPGLIDKGTIEADPIPQGFENESFYRFMVAQRYQKNINLILSSLNAAGQTEVVKNLKNNSITSPEMTTLRTTLAKSALEDSLAESNANFMTLTLASKDPLTGIWNRQAYEVYFQYLYSLLESYEDSQDISGEKMPRIAGVALIDLDIDHFKHINDTWGHIAGDQVLSFVGEKMRPFDFVFRTGGEELAIVMPIFETPDIDINSEEGQKRIFNRGYEIVKSLCSNLEVAYTPAGGEPVVINFTISAGMNLATRETIKGMNATSFREITDELLYQAKEKGRNRFESPFYSQTLVGSGAQSFGVPE